MKRAIIIGAGPAGLTAAYELLAGNAGLSDDEEQIEVCVLEESDTIGGISRTVTYHGNRMDMGGHRLFSKIPEVNAWWEKMLPLQGAPAWDDRKLDRSVSLMKQGPDPEKQDCVMLLRHRISRIFFDNKFYDYPISMKPETFHNMGLICTLQVGFSYLHARLFRKPETNLENFYRNHFGQKLYEMFFEYYTESVWGKHPRDIDASWGRQRVRGISVAGVLKDAWERTRKQRTGKTRNVQTSLIEQFKYPKLGPGQLWEVTAQKVEALGGRILMNTKVTGICKDEKNHICSVTCLQGGEQVTYAGDFFLSSMPLKDLVAGMNDVPPKERAIAQGLPYRDYMTLGVLCSSISLKNQTGMRTIGDIVPDCWVYVQDRRVKMGRFQIYNNWSPYMVRDPEHTVWIGLEYFVQEGDALWRMTQEEFTAFGIREMIRIGLIPDGSVVLDSHLERVKKAYPAYFDTYCEIDQLITYLSAIDNLYCIGRNGQHRYNNIDHSMCTSFEAVKNIRAGQTDKRNIWSVNTEATYHEEKRKKGKSSC